jgi:hypothetical protein
MVPEFFEVLDETAFDCAVQYIYLTGIEDGVVEFAYCYENGSACEDKLQYMASRYDGVRMERVTGDPFGIEGILVYDIEEHVHGTAYDPDVDRATVEAYYEDMLDDPEWVKEQIGFMKSLSDFDEYRRKARLSVILDRNTE